MNEVWLPRIYDWLPMTDPSRWIYALWASFGNDLHNSLARRWFFLEEVR